MPKYDITSPDGAKYQVDAPEGASPAEVMKFVQSHHEEAPQPAPPQMSRLQRFGTGFMDAFYGASQLGARMGEEGIPGPGAEEHKADLTRRVDERVKQREAGIEATSGVEKGSTDWWRAGGNILQPLNYIPAVAGGIPGAIAGGALGGALQPATSDDFAFEKLGQVTTGGVLGGTLGVAGKAAGAGVRELGQFLAREYPENIATQAVQKILRRMGQDQRAGGPSAQDALNLINEASSRGKPMTLADVGGANVQGLAGNVTRQPGSSRNIGDQFLTQRDEGAAGRISQDIYRYVHGGPTMRQTTEALQTARSAAGRPNYNQVHALQGVWSPRLQQFLDHPDLRRGMARGYREESLEALAAGEPFNPTQIGVDHDAEGNIRILHTPNMRVLDMGKRGLDAMIADERNEITGRLSSMGVALNRVRAAYIQEIDSLDRSGVYRRARESWSGLSRSMDAVRMGRTIFQQSPEENAAMIGELTAGDREFFRVGVADLLRERLGKTGFSGDEAKSIIKNSWMRDQLRSVFRSEGDFNSFVRSVTDERTMFGTRYRTVGNSLTAARAAEDLGEDHTIFDQTVKVGQAVATQHWLTAIKTMIKMKRDLGMANNPALNERIAEILFATPIDPRSEVAQRLTGTFRGPQSVNPLAGAARKTGAAGAIGAGPLAGVINQPSDMNSPAVEQYLAEWRRKQRPRPLEDLPHLQDSDTPSHNPPQGFMGVSG